MTIKYWPPTPLPEGVRHYMDVLSEIEKAEGLRSLGFHYAFEPGQGEINSIAQVHERCDPSELVAKHIDTGGRDRGWTVFRTTSQASGEGE